MVHLEGDLENVAIEFSKSYLTICRDSLSYLKERLQEESLDAFIMAFLFKDFHEDDTYWKILDKEKFIKKTLTETELAILGIILYVDKHRDDEASHYFKDNLERIKGKQVAKSGLSLKGSLKLMLGASLGILQFYGDSALVENFKWLKEQLQNFRDKSNARNFILTYYIENLLKSGKEKNKLVEELAVFILSLRGGEISHRDKIAILWAVKRKFYPEKYKKDLQDFENRLLRDVLILEMRGFDVIDHFMTYDYLYTLSSEVTSLRDKLSQINISSRHDIVFKILNNFHISVTSLIERRKGKAPFKIDDEYDVQDLLYIMLKPIFEDLEREEYTARDAGSQKRVDLVIRDINAVIEAKCVMNSIQASKVGDELKIDIESYYNHPNCETLFIFIYNPNRKIKDPRVLEKNLSGERRKKDKEFIVRAVVRPE